MPEEKHHSSHTHCYQDEETRKPAWCSSAFSALWRALDSPEMALLSWLASTIPDNSGCKEALSSLLLEDGDFVYLFDCFSSYKGRALCKVPWHLQYLDRMRLLWGSPIMRVLGSFGQLKSKPLVLRLLLSGEVLLPCVSQIKEVLWQKTNCVETNVCLSDGLTLWTDSLWSLTCGKERGAAVLA